MNQKLTLISDSHNDNLEKIRVDFETKLDLQSKQNLKLQDFILELMDNVESQKTVIGSQEEQIKL